MINQLLWPGLKSFSEECTRKQIEVNKLLTDTEVQTIKDGVGVLEDMLQRDKENANIAMLIMHYRQFLLTDADR